MLKGIIFDFDGVIAESVQVKSDAFVELYKPYGTDVMKKVFDHHEANGGMSRYEKLKIYHESFLNKTISEEKITDLAKQFSELVVKKVIDCPYVPGALDFIQESYNQYKLFISTGTPTEEIKLIIASRGISQYFSDVFGSPEKKTDHIKKIISKYGLKCEEILFFGDSNSDIDAAFCNSVPFILRLHTLNKNHFVQYTGQTIKNFKNLDSDILYKA